jgi:dienelactone hydrolase
VKLRRRAEVLPHRHSPYGERYRQARARSDGARLTVSFRIALVLLAFGLFIQPAWPRDLRGDGLAVHAQPKERFAAFVQRFYHENGPQNPPALQGEVVRKEDGGSHSRWYLKYEVEPGETAVGWLLIPEAPPQGGREKYPLVLALHPTHAMGKEVVIGAVPGETAAEQIKAEQRAYGLDLVERGFVVFAPDRAGYGERGDLKAYTKRFRSRWPRWNMTTGKAVWDLRRALDFLLSDSRFAFVDPSRIGAIGHSLGAWDAVMLAAYEGFSGNRIKAVVANAGPGLRFEETLFTDQNGCAKQYLEDATCPLLDNTKDRFIRSTNLLIMLLAPTPLLVISGINDPSYRVRLPRTSWHEGFKTITQYYLAERSRTQGEVGNWRAPFSLYVHSDAHSFSREARTLAYAFLARHLYAE